MNPLTGLRTQVVAFLLALAPGTVCISTGLPQTRKSTYWQAAYGHAMRTSDGGPFRRFVVFDPYARRDRLREAAGERVSPWGGHMVLPSTLIARPELLCWDPLYLVVAPDDGASPETLAREFQATARLAWKVGGITLYAEELGLYGREASVEVNRWATGSGHVGGVLGGACQRFSRIQIDARHNVRKLIVHPTAGAELGHIRELCGPEFAAQVSRLRPPSEDGSFPGDPPLTWAIGQQPFTSQEQRP